MLKDVGAVAGAVIGGDEVFADEEGHGEQAASSTSSSLGQKVAKRERM